MRWLGVKFNDNDYKNILALVDEMAPDFVHIGASIQNKDSDAFKTFWLKKIKTFGHYIVQDPINVSDVYVIKRDSSKDHLYIIFIPIMKFVLSGDTNA